LQQNGQVGVLLLNESRTTVQIVNVTIANATLASTGTRYQFGTNNFTGTTELPTSPPTTNSVSGLGNSFSVTVPAYTMVVLTIPLSNNPPVLPPINDQFVNVGQVVSLSANATDSDLPPQSLAYTLLSAPQNAMLDPGTGALSWRPAVTDADTTNTFQIKVSDSGIPSMSATQSFAVTVNPLTLPTLTSAALSAGQFSLQIIGDSGPDYEIQVSTNLVDWTTAFVTNSPPMPFLWTDTNAAILPAQFYRVIVGPPLP
jgi:hypothetical protein